LKHIHRFFVAKNLAAGQSVCLSPEDSFHAGRVLRLRPGDITELAGADGHIFKATVAKVDGTVEVTTGPEVIYAPAPAIELSVAQSLPKGKKFDLIVEKLSELGVTRLAPVISEKSVISKQSDTSGKLERWRRIARSSAAQSRRDKVMDIEEPCDMHDWLDNLSGTLMVLTTEAATMPLGSAASQLEFPVTLLVGPEAGFSAAEINEFRERGAVLVGLGPRILRTETAAMVAAAIILHHLGHLG